MCAEFSNQSIIKTGKQVIRKFSLFFWCCGKIVKLFLSLFVSLAAERGKLCELNSQSGFYFSCESLFVCENIEKNKEKIYKRKSKSSLLIKSG